MGTDTGNSAYLGTKELLKVLPEGAKIAHFTGFLVDPNTQLRIDAVEKAVRSHPNVVAVSPLFGGAPLKGPADAVMAELCPCD